MKRVALGALGVALVILGCAGEDEGLTAHGTIEVRENDVAPTIPGRIVRVLVDEGDSVTAGDTLAVMTQATLPADIEARQARLATAIAQMRDLEAGARAPELERAAAELRAARSEAERTARDLERMDALFAGGAVSQQELDAARNAAQIAASRRDAASDALTLLQEGSRPEQIRAARGEVANARAAVDAALATAADLVLTAPAGGVVLGRHAEPGEAIAAGVPVLTIGRTNEPWVRVYVPAHALPSIAVGQPVAIQVSGLDRELTGRVAAINDRAEFTPRVALTEEERADQLFGVKVDVEGEGIAVVKPGMPAIVRFRAATAASPGSEDGRP